MPKLLILIVAIFTGSVSLLTSAHAQSPFGRHFFGLPSPFGILKGVVRGPHSYRSRSHRALRQQAVVPERARAQLAQQDVSAEGSPPAANAAASAAATSFNIYEEIVGYALWPEDYAQRFWSRGYRELLATVIRPASGPNGTCGTEAAQLAGRPLDRIEQEMTLDDGQRDRLTKLRAAVNEAIERGKAACLDAPPARPSEQLEAMMNALWAMSDAEILFRTPLDSLYISLSDEQKSKLQGDHADKTVGGPSSTVCTPAANGTPLDDMLQAATQQSGQATKEQQEDFKRLHTLSAELSKYLADACPQETPSTPVARLDAASDRVQALLYAGINLAPAMAALSSAPADDPRKSQKESSYSAQHRSRCNRYGAMLYRCFL
jgi:LTXXQ motif family protein